MLQHTRFNHEALVEFNIKLQDRATRHNSTSGRSMSRPGPGPATSWPERAALLDPRQTSDTSQQVTCDMMFLNSHHIHCQMQKKVSTLVAQQSKDPCSVHEIVRFPVVCAIFEFWCILEYTSVSCDILVQARYMLVFMKYIDIS